MTKSLNLKIIENIVNSCQKCELHKNISNYVFDRGNPNSYITIIGEGAGEVEDQKGIPFVGPSGQLLDQALTELGIDPNNDVYVCNIIKCRPPNNRTPTEEEINCCIDYLEQQLKIVQPKIIITLGNVATQTITNTPFGITKVRGKILKYGKTPVVPSYHPSYILRSGGDSSIEYVLFKQDIQLAISRVK